MEALPDRRTVRAVYAATVAGMVLWLGAIFAAPWLAGRGADGAARFLYAAFAPTCHQITERCFALGGHPLAVCGRCLGVYAGFAAGLALYPFVRGFSRLALPRARVFVLSILPLALDGVAGVLGLWRSPMEVRFLTGLAWGAILPLYFVTGVADLVLTRRRRRSERGLEKSRGPT
ncbi:MAG: DUF2085 domain-containing protein [Candidatus Aminicenantes bacterium]|nr:DUF2085 domain-containing protein [Candidatus Aminicenantes bacterium]NTV81918.1 DUF2085 domain-containing protein [Candidatus Aminicenantes bacterium]